MKPVYVLGGFQTDFAYSFAKNRLEIFDLLKQTVEGGLSEVDLEPHEIEVAHIGNLGGELFSGQGQLGGLFALTHPAFYGVPSSRHEAACASGSVATLAAMADIEAERYGLACVVGLELMKNVSAQVAAEHLGAAAWRGHELTDSKFPWPRAFSNLGDEYDSRYGLDPKHLKEISRINFENAKKNPKAQTRAWTMDDASFSDDEAKNPVVEGRIRKHDCSQVTDGGAVVFLASEAVAKRYSARRGIALDTLSKIEGFGHTTAPLPYALKVEKSRSSPYVFPWLRHAFLGSLSRAGLSDVGDLHGLEVHDCFTTTEYMIIDHVGLTRPGRSFEAIEDGRIRLGGRCPVNPSGGLIGAGHPIGATGVRMVLDAHRQVTGQAGANQVDGARRFGTLNIGGSATTTVAFVVGRGA
ncbi:MAG: thiolase domain-containing protein [Deltaproteobacteria bacterium]|nr:thiolase domain-containing protein [Deltaproteobacteria bacterium]